MSVFFACEVRRTVSCFGIRVPQGPWVERVCVGDLYIHLLQRPGYGQKWDAEEGATQTPWKEEQLSFSSRDTRWVTENQARLLSLSSIVIITWMPPWLFLLRREERGNEGSVWSQPQPQSTRWVGAQEGLPRSNPCQNSLEPLSHWQVKSPVSSLSLVRVCALRLWSRGICTAGGGAVALAHVVESWLVHDAPWQAKVQPASLALRSAVMVVSGVLVKDPASV